MRVGVAWYKVCGMMSGCGGLYEVCGRRGCMVRSDGCEGVHEI